MAPPFRLGNKFTPAYHTEVMKLTLTSNQQEDHQGLQEKTSPPAEKSPDIIRPLKSRKKEETFKAERADKATSASPGEKPDQRITEASLHTEHNPATQIDPLDDFDEPPYLGNGFLNRSQTEEKGVETVLSRPGIAFREARPVYKLNPPPEYPLSARRRGYQGTVTLEVLVDRHGRVKDQRVSESSGYDVLDRAAVSSVRSWEFEPGIRGDQKIDMWVKIPVRFQLLKD